MEGNGPSTSESSRRAAAGPGFRTHAHPPSLFLSLFAFSRLDGEVSFDPSETRKGPGLYAMIRSFADKRTADLFYILLEEFLRPLGLTQATLARHLDVSLARVNELVKGKRSVTAETAWLLAQAFGTTPQFWINMQSNYDLTRTRPAHSVAKIRRAS